MNQNNELLRFSLKLFLIFSIGIGGLLHCTTEPIHPVLEFVQSEVIPDSGKVIESPSEPCIPKKEICDGIDNNCDGIVDEVCCFPNKIISSFEVIAKSIDSSYSAPNFAFSPDGKEVAYVLGAHNVTVAQVKDGAPIRTNIQTNRFIKSIIYHPSGKSIFLAESELSFSSSFIVNQYTLHDGKKIRSFIYPLTIPSKKMTLAVSPNGDLLAGISGYTKIKEKVPFIVWNIKDATIHFIKKTYPTDFFSFMTFNQDGKYIATTHNTNTLKLWDSSSGELIYSYTASFSGQITAISFHPNNQSLVALAFSLGCKVIILDFKKKQIVKELVPPDRKRPNRDCSIGRTWMSLSFSPDGSWLVSAQKGEGLFFWYVNGYKKKSYTVITEGKDWDVHGFQSPLLMKWSKNNKQITTTTNRHIRVVECNNR